MKKHRLIKIIIILFMLLICSFSIYRLYLSFSINEIKTAKNFISELQDNDMISQDIDIDSMRFSSDKKENGINVDSYYRVYTDTYDIEIDQDLKVIGFKNREVKLNETQISDQDAKLIATKYVQTIINEDVFFKEMIKDDESLPYYSFSFTKFLNGYPCYNDDIIVNIDKSKGLLDGYSNYSIKRNVKDAQVNISTQEAEMIAKNNFSLINPKFDAIYTYIDSVTFKAYATNKDKSEYELCYIVNVGAEDKDQKKEKSIILVSAESGDVINLIKDNISTTTY